MAKRMTYEEKEAKRETEKAERRAKRVAEFRASFRKDTARRVYDERSIWDTNDAIARTIYALLDKFRYAKDKLSRELLSMAEAAVETRERTAKNWRPYYSNGLAARYAEVDQLQAQVEAYQTAILTVARYTGWRVREIEADDDRELADRAAKLDVVKTGDTFGVLHLEPGGTATWLDASSDGPVFGPTGVCYATEDEAWEALYVVVHGRPMDHY